MTYIYKSNDVNIQKKNDGFLFEIKKRNDFNQKFLDSLNLKESVKTTSEKKCFKSGVCKINFKTYSVVSLKKFLSSNNNSLDYLDLVSLFLCLKKQIDFLKSKGLGILFFNIDDIVAIKTEKLDKKLKFLYLNTDKIFELVENNIVVTKSFDKKNKNNFLSPELITLNSIPFNIDYRSCFFSLALLIAFCIEGNKIDFFKPINWDVDDFKKILEPIDNTKLFWALLRCQELDPNDRFLLWI